MKWLNVLFLLGLLVLSGCILEYREGLPAVITISEMPKPEPENLLCESPPCSTLVQMSQVKRTEYVCSPLYKGANDDPRGTTYNTQLGGECKVIEKPTTVCLKYDCDFDKAEGTGYYEINMVIGKRGVVLGDDNYEKLTYLGVALPNEKLISAFWGGSLGKFGEDQNLFYYSFLNGEYVNGKYTSTEIVDKSYHSLSYYEEKNCLANMPIKYPYNSIDFAYNPIVIRNTNTPTPVLRNLQTDYTYLTNLATAFTSETDIEGVDDPCSELCNIADESFISTGIIDESKQEECNECQENRKKDLRDKIKSKKETAVEYQGGYSYNDLSVKKDGTSFCTGLTPCVEIDRSQTKHLGDGSYDERYFVCQCVCDVVTYATYTCTRAGDSTEYFYTACEKNDVTSDQGGYIFSVHGFEAELFKNILGNSENKMLTFMVGQGPTFEEYSRAREECEPEITADVTIEAGNKRLEPTYVEVFSGSPICFKNDGTKTRQLFIQEFYISGISWRPINLLTNLSSGDSVCYDTGPDTNFTLGTTYVYVDDYENNKYRAKVNVLEPSNVEDINNKIKLNENGELKFFYNNEIELSTLYTSAPFSKILKNSQEISFDSYDSGEFFICDNEDGKEKCITWISYKTGVSSMTVREYSLYNEIFDFDSDGYIDIYDYLLCEEKNPNPLKPGAVLCGFINPYFNDLVNGAKKFDYPNIRKNVNYLEFTPSAITLPIGSKLCISNPTQRGLNLILEIKNNPIFNYNGGAYLNSMDIPSPTNNLLMYGYENSNFKTFLKANSEKSFTFLSSLREMNKNYDFVQAQSVASGLECCFTLSEPGVYRVSSLEGLSGSGHIIVFPNDIGNTIILNDYEYSPKSVVPIEGDFMCINNPYDFDRNLSLEGTFKGEVNLPASSKICSYDWANKKDNKINFVDTTTGGSFDVQVTNSSILNIEVVNSIIMQSKGKIREGGTVCFINNEEVETKIYYSLVTQSTSNSFIILKGNSMDCSIKFSKGLHKIFTEQVEESLITAQKSEYYLLVADDNEGYIYNKTIYGSPLTFYLEKFDDLTSTDVTKKPSREIKLYSGDNTEYHLYTKISFDNKIGFSTTYNYIQTPEIIFENTGNGSLTINVYNYGEIEQFSLDSKKYIKYNYREGDYKVELTGTFYPMDTLPNPRKSTTIETSRMLINKDVKYISNSNNPTFTYTTPIKFTNRLIFNVSSSITQSVHFGKQMEEKKPTFSNPIYGSIIIESQVDSVSILEMQKLSGNYNNLDFGVQVLNGVPSSDILLQAKQMLAYDRSLPVFMYSRIGNVELNLNNPYKTEIYEIPKGANVSYVISDWILSSKPPSYSIKNAYVSSSKPVVYGETNYNILKEDIDFTIDTGTNTKLIKVKAVEDSKTIVMDYTPFEIKKEGNSPFKYVINNLAYEPRAFTLRPSNTKGLCIEFTQDSKKSVNLYGEINSSASYMKLYSLTGSSNNFETIEFHDDLLSYSNSKEVSDILILPNYGLNDVKINLVRNDAGDEVGELYLAPDEISTNKLNFNFISGFISGLNETKYVRAYRFYGDQDKLKINVDSTVYIPPIGSDLGAYSIIARAFTTSTNPTERLIGTANVYLRLKNAKAVPNKWYMAGLVDTTFAELLKGFDTYKNPEIYGNSDSSKIYEGTQSQWVPTGCGDFILLVPFNNQLYPQAFAYDVPQLLELGGNNRADLTYMLTTKLNYKYAIQKLNSIVNNNNFYSDIELSNGEIINDVRIKMSENPFNATHICGYYNVDEPFKEVGDFAGDYSETESDNCFEKYVSGDFPNDFVEGKDDFEFDVESNVLLKNLKNLGFAPSDSAMIVYDGAVMIYTPTGIYCGWGGGSNGKFCDDKGDPENCKYYNGNSMGDYTNADFCDGYNYDGTCLGNIGSCIYYSTQKEVNNTKVVNNCKEDPEYPSKEDLKNYGDSYTKECDNSNYWISVDGKGNKGGSSGPNSDIDYIYDQRVWWCRYNIDAFAHETTMFPSQIGNSNNNDHWNILEVQKLAPSVSLIEEFDTGLSYNPNLYDYMSDGYFDIFGIDKGKDNCDNNISINCDRGNNDDNLTDYYYSIFDVTDNNITKMKKYDKGLSEDALTGGLFFMLNSVDTGDYFFSKEVNVDYVEKSRGYIFSRSFTVTNNEGRKLLCVGADTFNGKDVILGPGANEHVLLDLRTDYTVYEPAYYTNLEVSDGKTFSHVSLFAHSPISNYNLGNFKFEKPVETDTTFIDPEPEYKGKIDINLYNLNVNLETSNGFESFEVVDLLQGQGLTLKNTGDNDIVWYYAPDELCNKGFTKLLNDRYTLMCSSTGVGKIKLDNSFSYIGGDSKYKDLIFVNNLVLNTGSGSNTNTGLISIKTIEINNFNLKIDNTQNYNHCINNPTLYSVNPSDIISYLDNVNAEAPMLKKVIVPAKGSIEITGDELIVIGNSGATEYLFYNPHTGKRFNVIVSSENYVVNIDINTFSQDSVNVFNNSESKLCFKNYDNTGKDLEIYPVSGLGSPSIKNIPSGVSVCLKYNEFNNKKIIDSILGRELKINLYGFSDQNGNQEVVSTIGNITRKIVETTPASNNPAYNFIELNVGASATPSIITTEIVDYKSINNGDNDMINLIADEVYAIVSNSKIKQESLCDFTPCYNDCLSSCITECFIKEFTLTQNCLSDCNTFCAIDCFSEESELPSGSICSDEYEIETSSSSETLSLDPNEIDCNEIKKNVDGSPFLVNGNSVYKYDDRKKCEATKQAMIDKIAEINEEVFPYTKVNEDKVLAMLPILIKFDNGKTQLTNSDVNKIKLFIDNVNNKVNEKCKGENCDNELINSGCSDDEIGIENRYLDMIGFIVLIDDPGISKKNNCSFINNYLTGVMNVSIHAATTLNNSKGEITKYGMSSMIVGFGVNRNPSALTSCWDDSEFKKEIETLYTSSFMIMLDKGIIGVGHYCLRDGECKPISTGIQGNDYGLYKTSSLTGNWDFKPIQINGIEQNDFIGLSDDDKSKCQKFGEYYFCDSVLNDVNFGSSGITLPSGSINLGLNSGVLSGAASNLNIGNIFIGGNNINFGNANIGAGLGGGVFSGISFGTGTGISKIPIVEVKPDILKNSIKKSPYANEWFDRCGRYYYNGEGMTMIVYPEKEIAQGQQGKSCNPGRVMEIYNQFNC